jgi:superfamily II DNA or RNA helicase
MMEWQDAYDEGIVYNDKRNKMIAVAAITMFSKDKKVLILVEAIDQGNSILEILRKKNLEVDFIYGKHSGEQRSEANNKIQSGELDILIASRVYNQGINIPLIDCVIIGGGYKSAILTYQRYGRGMTKRGDKTETIVIDFFDKGSYFLEKHSQERISLVNEEKAFKIEYKTIGEL